MLFQKLSHTGGCSIGARPIDLHVSALRQMGITINDEAGFLVCNADAIKNTRIQLDIPSVGATENIILASVLGKGTTTIYNAANEPEIADLQRFLNSCGAKVSGAGTSIVTITGVTKLTDTEHTIIPDRIEAGTFLTAAAITGGEIRLCQCEPKHLYSLFYKLKEAGCTIRDETNSVLIKAPKRLNSVNKVITNPYPGFPTDMQAQMMSLLTIAKGTSIIFETVFESRFRHADELNRMGADVSYDGRIAIIKGVKQLKGTQVTSTDLRAGACLILAGLAAEGETTVTNSHFVERGYESIESKLKTVGAKINLNDL